MLHEYAPLVLYFVCVFKNGLLNETNLSVTKLFRERISKDLNTAREEEYELKIFPGHDNATQLPIFTSF